MEVEKKLKEEAFVSLVRHNTESERRVNTIVQRLKSNVNYNLSYEQLWQKVSSNVATDRLYRESNPALSYVISALSNAEITRADISTKGTQLKLLLRLKGGQSVFFKPMRYKRDEIIRESPYAGFDRHNGEIVAFHLSRLLRMPLVPITSGRKIDIENEVKRTASKRLLQTFLKIYNQSTNCFYGRCYYCKPKHSVCPDLESGLLEGAAIFLLPQHFTLKRVRSPWQRTYKNNVLARWEVDSRYCHDKLMKTITIEPHLLNFVDVAIFDYLIGNADRHHYEMFKDVPNSPVLLIDNGKSFGNPFLDEFTILAPLFQCCVIRKSTYELLLLFLTSRKQLSRALDELLITDALYPLLNDAHLKAIDRRLLTIVALVNVCIDQNVNKALY
ncbi:glycosaminoglycan xylosylkinase-like protein [Dinothrombium tinctorium]|uniref:Glycosaminoglycan xylosylkinase-like protein n=1 Tax=Dinothrombium tinctorium TaxID=1965070 RepID=A0A3S4RDQ3_9ACAR|nr:glycosaminoglycan xylosylkinase-like protein [Dinothrombium tinctorium]RWS14921.1 glycosaminoglycan xylosylkinase-like protein [Dinothrombium tinctorium]RWS16761.1 glycosaminoglycan xylosylkinase-like protein [Dinothrombium tinctorium]